ncbi:hypothetical protein MLGJGCBP_03104 [Rhodococcus sp. T7]|nr:hypothetical protein MLGJGCBP_09398 [Rhodococcus sp. T7]KAF0963760.1 hypothetical protein MLGJGCBP_03104 [Rhodococcus sp. T7]
MGYRRHRTHQCLRDVGLFAPYFMSNKLHIASDIEPTTAGTAPGPCPRGGLTNSATAFVSVSYMSTAPETDRFRQMPTPRFGWSPLRVNRSYGRPVRGIPGLCRGPCGRNTRIRRRNGARASSAGSLEPGHNLRYRARRCLTVVAFCGDRLQRHHKHCSRVRRVPASRTRRPAPHPRDLNFGHGRDRTAAHRSSAWTLDPAIPPPLRRLPNSKLRTPARRMLSDPRTRSIHPITPSTTYRAPASALGTGFPWPPRNVATGCSSLEELDHHRERPLCSAKA